MYLINGNRRIGINPWLRRCFAVIMILMCPFVFRISCLMLSKLMTTMYFKSSGDFDYAAVIVDDRASEALIRAVQNVIKNIPRDWPVQIITLAEHRSFLQMSALKDHIRYGKVLVTVLNHAPRNSFASPKDYSNAVLTSVQLWRQVRGEKVLIFQTDSTFCSNSSYKVTDFLTYDFIGAPWVTGGCCNGEFSLRSRKKMFQVLSHANFTGTQNEDIWYSNQLLHVNASIASPEVARMFSVETLYHPNPLAIHKPSVEKLGIKNMRRLCNECPESQVLFPYCFR